MVNIIGKRFSSLVVIDVDMGNVINNKYKQKYICKCDCGNTIKTTYANLIYNHTRSCGCMRDKVAHERTVNLIGKKFGRLTVVEKLVNDKNKTVWKCICECGNETIVETYHLKTGHTQSCGCLIRDTSSKTNFHHGMTGDRIYAIWKSMRMRCVNENYTQYKNYGGRGISVCEEWNNFENFYEWAMANGYDENAPRGKCTIDRIDVNGNYEPSNCRWVTAREQSNNKTNNHIIEFNGEKHTISEWSRITGVKQSTLWERLNKPHWSITDALTKPVQTHSKI